MSALVVVREESEQQMPPDRGGSDHSGLCCILPVSETKGDESAARHDKDSVRDRSDVQDQAQEQKNEGIEAALLIAVHRPRLLPDIPTKNITTETSHAMKAAGGKTKSSRHAAPNSTKDPNTIKDAHLPRKKIRTVGNSIAPLLEEV